MKWFLLLLLLLIILFVIWWFMRRQSASADPMDAYSPTSEDGSGSSATTDAADTGNGWEAEPVAAAPMVQAPAAEPVAEARGAAAPAAEDSAASSDWASEVPDTTESDEAVDLTADGDDAEPEVNIATSTGAGAGAGAAAATSSAAAASAAASDEPAAHGPGSAKPAADGSGPAGWTVKGNEDSMLYHSPESPWYARTRAEVWFRDEPAAQAAGFTRWDHKD
ncbi:MAG: hypothetical protein ABI131_12320 [Nostocoides sp.]